MTTILVCGSRTFKDTRFVVDVLDNAPFDISTIVQGMAPGADTIAAQYSYDRFIPTCCHPANWPKYGKRAGYVRNAAMLSHHSGFGNHHDITRCVAFIDKDLPTSRGTMMMCKLADEKDVKVFVCDSRDRSVVPFVLSDYDV